MNHRERSYIGLGANIGDAMSALTQAVQALDALPDVSVTAVSSLYRTRPVGPVAQPDFYNAVARLDGPAGPDPEAGAMALLIALKQLERAFGRQGRERWGPREIDLDLLTFGDHHLHVARPDAGRSDDPERTGAQWLEVPHPAASQRLFVLAPWADLEPDLRPAGWNGTVAQLAARASRSEDPGAVELWARWDPAELCWS